jgi:DNA-binding response OmpR family regulator
MKKNISQDQPSNLILQNIPSKTIAIIDDEPDIVELISINLTKAGFKTKKFLDGNTFLVYLKGEIPDAIILDLMLPDTDGFEICKYMRKEEKYSAIPILMLTAKSEETDKVLGLELGADDYVTKPFSPRELIARIKAILRREGDSTKTSKIKLADILEIDLQKYETYVKGTKIELTSTEFRILKLLSGRKGWVFSREQILDYLEVHEKGVLDRTVDVHIKNLREKLSDAGKFIKNIRGIGYKLDV